MSSRWLWGSVLMFSMVLLGPACNDAEPTYYKDVQPILAKSCLGCHSAGGLGSVELESFEDVYGHRLAIANRVADRTMPPWHADSSKRIYQDDPSLTDAEIDTIVAWATGAAGVGDAPAGDLPGPTLSSGVVPDLTVSMGKPYLPQPDTDDYRCFLIDLPFDEVRYVTGFDLEPGAPELAHHAITFLVFPDAVSEMVALDAAAEGPGWPCYGGPGGRWLDFLNIGGLGGWIPGFNTHPYPQGTGIEVEPGSAIVLQMHYNTLAADPVSERTTIQLQTAPDVERVGTYMGFVSPQWVLTDGLQIPAGEIVSYEFRFDFSTVVAANLSALSLTDKREPMRLYSVILHAHNLATSISLEVLRQDGSQEWLVDIPDWDFAWQREYVFAESVRIDPGDELRLACTYDNTVANQPVIGGEVQQPRDVTWGDGSLDEMCLAVVYMTLDR